MELLMPPIKQTPKKPGPPDPRPKPKPGATWRHADGSVRADHMDARPGDYYH